MPITCFLGRRSCRAPLKTQSCSESLNQASLPHAFLAFQRNIVGTSPMSRSVIKHLLFLLQSISLSHSHPWPKKQLFYEEKNMSESLEMLNGPQDLTAQSQSPRGRIISETDASCLSGPWLLGTLILGNPWDPPYAEACKDPHQEMIPYLLLSTHREKPHPTTTPNPLNCSSG